MRNSWPSESAVNPADNLNYEGFRALARDPRLSKYQRIGFPDSYREGFEEAIFADICAKLRCLTETGKIVVDIGAGSSELPQMLIELCMRRQHLLALVDSPEMLAHLPNTQGVEKVAGRFPDCRGQLSHLTRRVHAVVCYSVLQYVFVDANFFDFVDQAMELLASGGRLLLGDIPNVSMRKRFFASDTGINAHQQYVGRNEVPLVAFNAPEPGRIDDAVVLAVAGRARAAGFHSFVVPQASNLPMADRREDILIIRP